MRAVQGVFEVVVVDSREDEKQLLRAGPVYWTTVYGAGTLTLRGPGSLSLSLSLPHSFLHSISRFTHPYVECVQRERERHSRLSPLAPIYLSHFQVGLKGTKSKLGGLGD